MKAPVNKSDMYIGQVRTAIKVLHKKAPELFDQDKKSGYIYSIESQTETILYKFLRRFSLANPNFRIYHFEIAQIVSKLISRLPEQLIHHKGIPLLYFLNKSGKEFIRYVFISILLREPSEYDYRLYQNRIISGNSSKLLIIHDVSTSPEGNSRKVKILGFGFVFKLYSLVMFRVPILSKIFRIILKMVHAIRYLPHYTSMLVDHDTAINAVDLRHQQDLHRINENFNNLDSHLFKHQAQIRKQKTIIKNVSVSVDNLIKSNYVPDDFYLAFENKFRGSEAEVTQRLKVYESVIQTIPKSIKPYPFADLGCGRGEWLSILSRNHYKTVGVDINPVISSKLSKKNITLINTDALDYLYGQRSDSHSGVTGFHILEHLDSRIIFKLIKETHRVLAKEGIAIFETPNPENLIVGACNFYYDLTHLKPIHPHTLQFVFEFLGFKKVEILRLHPLDFMKSPKNKELDTVSRLFNNNQDFSIIAYK